MLVLCQVKALDFSYLPKDLDTQIRSYAHNPGRIIGNMMEIKFEQLGCKIVGSATDSRIILIS